MSYPFTLKGNLAYLYMELEENYKLVLSTPDKLLFRQWFEDLMHGFVEGRYRIVEIEGHAVDEIITSVADMFLPRFVLQYFPDNMYAKRELLIRERKAMHLAGYWMKHKGL